ncbi:MAG: HIT family hydrolase [Candidatus [Bacteroides] periocalifornicus]|jgi:hypothetical protein|uniref:HIT family hydrolase n=1 Tax=Candidatus [Bacteroides] periocalifornicus TaxID=1702214 RepID=A0A0Q4B4P2_9BACT|nr:MAG: HIT family hydrolase [Candidatus [Bacteroides] periocalifornicus]
MPTLFTRIIQGEIPCHRVAESDLFLAFLDINPLRAGHTLVVPKVEQDYIFNLPPEYLQGMLPFAQRVARAIELVVTCKRIGLAVIGLEVPHAHLHLVPISQEGDLNFTNPRAKLTDQEFKELATKIARAYQAL